MGLNFDIGPLTEKLAQMDKKMKKDLTIKALEAGAKPIEKELINTVPVDTGELQGCIKTTPVKLKKGGSKIYVGVPKEAGRKNVEKAWLHNIGFRGRGGLFYFDQSFETQKDEALSEIARVIREGLKE